MKTGIYEYALYRLGRYSCVVNPGLNFNYLAVLIGFILTNRLQNITNRRLKLYRIDIHINLSTQIQKTYNNDKYSLQTYQMSRYILVLTI